MIKKNNVAVVLMNLGSPASTEVADVKKYLDEFLMDPRVIDKPLLLRTLLVKGIITPFRAKNSAEAYRSIWTKEGSPLVHITRQAAKALSEISPYSIYVAMRYGSPDMQSAFDAIKEKQKEVEHVVLLPLYPHYAMSSYETAVEHAKAIHAKGKYGYSISFVPPFYNHPTYINALANSIIEYKNKYNCHLLFSYHSIPVRHVEKTDVTGEHCFKNANCCTVPSAAHNTCYRHQCFETTRLVAEKLGLGEKEYSIAFQSKLGREAWLTPATTKRMEEMPQYGIKKVMVVCPSFVSDCLETLEEIAIREMENFKDAGGEDYVFIPCMNTQPMWINAMQELVNEAVKGHIKL
ncbi:MAG: ferrochelatase [Chitinophagia bacterium]|nr:ferrochelatase [Chitinophagia bacterium]